MTIQRCMTFGWDTVMSNGTQLGSSTERVARAAARLGAFVGDVSLGQIRPVRSHGGSQEGGGCQ